MRNCLFSILFLPALTFAQMPNQLLWEISGNNLQSPSYLFGTIHSNDRRVFDFADSVYITLNNSKAVVLETDVFQLFDKIDPREEEVKLDFDSEGNPFSAKWDPTITLYGDEDGMPQFMDAFFEQYALNANKDFFTLESISSQLSIRPPAVDKKKARKDINEYFLTEETMIDIYLSGNVRRMEDEVRTALADYPDYYNRLIIERNNSMAKGIDSLMQKESCFIAIGASHLAGNEGILAQLISKGYKVRPIKYTNKSTVFKEEREVKSKQEYLYRYEDLGLNVLFPGKPMEITPKNDAYQKRIIYRDLGQGNTYLVEILTRTDEMDLDALAEELIASPAESPVRMIELENEGIAFEGVADTYPEGYSWVRVTMTEDVVIVLKVYGGNKFMNSNRYQLFFDRVWLD